MSDLGLPYAAVTPGLVIWDRAADGLSFLKAKGLPRETRLYALSEADFAELDQRGWVGMAAERIAARGRAVSFEIVEAAPC